MKSVLFIDTLFCFASLLCKKRGTIEHPGFNFSSEDPLGGYAFCHCGQLFNIGDCKKSIA